MNIYFKKADGFVACVKAEGGPSAIERVIDGIRSVDPNAIFCEEEPKPISLVDALNAARFLNDPVEEEAAEYRRGQLDLMASIFGVDGMPTDERMEELAKLLGWPIPK